MSISKLEAYMLVYVEKVHERLEGGFPKVQNKRSLGIMPLSWECFFITM